MRAMSSFTPLFALFFIGIPCCCEAQAIPDCLARSVIYLFDNSTKSVCPTIPTTVAEANDLVLQPGTAVQSRLNGTFFFPDNVKFFTVFQNGCLSQGMNRFVTDSLIFRAPPDTSGLSNGVISICYTPFSNPSQNISFNLRYAPRGIYLNGDTDTPIILMEDDILMFEARSRESESILAISVCEIFPDGSHNRSQRLTARSPVIDASCAAPDSGAGQFSISTVRVSLVTNATLGPIQFYLSNSNVCNRSSGVLVSSVFNATIRSVPPETTTMEPTSVGTTSSPVVENRLIYIIIGAVAGAAVLILIVVGILILILVVVCAKRKGRSPGVYDAAPAVVNEDVFEKVPDPNENHSTEETSFTQPMDAVSRIAFVTSGGSTNYRTLEDELESLHGCERVQPAAEGNFDDFSCDIVRLLKRENCLVYIIWSGSLDTLNGMHNPVLKPLVHFLTAQSLHADPPGSGSIMHRIIFLQLGSKGDVDHTVSSLNSIHVFWNVSAEDPSFDAKACGRHVCKLVKGLRMEEQTVHEKPQKSTAVYDKSDPAVILALGEALGEIKTELKTLVTESRKGHEKTHDKIDGVDEKVSEMNDLNNILPPEN